jgi:hypothetical protein
MSQSLQQCLAHWYVGFLNEQDTVLMRMPKLALFLGYLFILIFSTYTCKFWACHRHSDPCLPFNIKLFKNETGIGADRSHEQGRIQIFGAETVQFWGPLYEKQYKITNTKLGAKINICVE